MGNCDDNTGVSTGDIQSHSRGERLRRLLPPLATGELRADAVVRAVDSPPSLLEETMAPLRHDILPHRAHILALQAHPPRSTPLGGTLRVRNENNGRDVSGGVSSESTADNPPGVRSGANERSLRDPGCSDCFVIGEDLVCVYFDQLQEGEREM